MGQCKSCYAKSKNVGTRRAVIRVDLAALMKNRETLLDKSNTIVERYTPSKTEKMSHIWSPVTRNFYRRLEYTTTHRHTRDIFEKMVHILFPPAKVSTPVGCNVHPTDVPPSGATTAARNYSSAGLLTPRPAPSTLATLFMGRKTEVQSDVLKDDARKLCRL